MAHNSAEHLLLWAACAQLGAICSPLSTRLASRELEAVLDALDPALVLGDEDHQAPLRAARPARWRAWAPPDALDAPRGPWPSSPSATSSAHDVALILWTSGSTGSPRGAALTHQAIMHNAQQFVQRLGLSAQDRALACSPLAHVAGLNVLTTPLIYAGGCSLIRSSVEPDALWPLVLKHQLTCAFGVPTLWTRWLEASAPERHTLRLGVVGGAPSAPSLHRAWWSRGVELCVGYGMTEASPMVTLARRAQLERSPWGVGSPGPRVRLQVRDERGQPLEPGQIGQLYVKAPNLMAGYWPHLRPTDQEPEWWPTGDLGALDERGELTLAGRVQELIFSGGLKVYASEVERQLEATGLFHEVAVAGVPDADLGQRVAAWVVWAQPPVGLDALRALLHDGLARYKHPRQLSSCQALPRLPSGKLDRRALLAQEPAR